ncbi:hypothetical protein EZI54_23870, partial [Marinobacter halodurans]
GSFLKLDASGVTLAGPSVKLNSGGAPGSGSGQSAELPEVPAGLEAAKGQRIEPAKLADVEQRSSGPAPSGNRKLIVDIIGGSDEIENVRAIKNNGETT